MKKSVKTKSSMFTIRFTDEQNVSIERIRKFLSSRKPAGYKDLDKTGAVRTIFQLGQDTFEAVYFVDKKPESISLSLPKLTKSENPAVERIDPSLFELQLPSTLRFGLTENPKLRDFIFEGFELLNAQENSTEDYPKLTEAPLLLIAQEYLDNNPDDKFKDNPNYSNNVLSIQLYTSEDALKMIGKQILHGTPSMVVGIKPYNSTVEAKEEINKALSFLGISLKDKETEGLVPSELHSKHSDSAFSKSLDFLNACIYHHQTKHNGLAPMFYLECCEALGEKFFEEVRKDYKLSSSQLTSQSLFGEYAKMLHGLITEAQQSRDGSFLSLSTHAYYRAFIETFHGTRLKQQTINSIVELLVVRQSVCATNPYRLPDPVMDFNNPTEQIKNYKEVVKVQKKKTPEMFKESLFFDTQGSLDGEVSDLIEALANNHSSNLECFTSAIDALLSKNYNLEELMRLK